jgi:hypothetical protein
MCEVSHRENSRGNGFQYVAKDSAGCSEFAGASPRRKFNYISVLRCAGIGIGA